MATGIGRKTQEKIMTRVTCLLFAVWICLSSASIMAQTNESDASRWLAHADIAPPFQRPRTKSAWETQRQTIRKQAIELLGKLPPRPKAPRIQTLSREDKGDYI